jgi:hypothetical protein
MGCSFDDYHVLALLTRRIAQHQELGFAAILRMLMPPYRLLDLRKHTAAVATRAYTSGQRQHLRAVSAAAAATVKHAWRQ